MGYTVHHDVPISSLSEEQVDAVTSDINKICDNFGRDNLEIEERGSFLEINGVGDDSCEPFFWDRQAYAHSSWFQIDPTQGKFTKTWRHPYGDVVLASCMAIKHHIPESRIGSDDIVDPARVKAQKLGGFNEDSREVQNAVDLYERTFPDRDVEHVLPYLTNYASQPDAVQSMVASAASDAGIAAGQTGKASGSRSKYDAGRARGLRSQGHTIAQVAQMMGVSASWVSQNTKGCR